MTKENLKIVENPPSAPRSEAREKLAAAIKRHDEAMHQVEACRKASETTHRLKAEAEDAVENAKTAVDKAKTDTARHMTDTALGRDTLEPKRIKEARAELTDAEDHRDAVVEAGAALKESSDAAATELYWAQFKLDDAIKEVIQADVGVVAEVAEFKKLAERLMVWEACLQWRDAKGILPPECKNWQGRPLLNLNEVKGEWPAAIAALTKDPDAPLPTGGN